MNQEEKKEPVSEAAPVPSPESKSPAVGKGKTVVVIDDDPTTLELVCNLLESVEFHVLPAGNGEAGWKMVNENKIDLVIVDAVMPGMDGFSFFKELKKSPTTQTIPVLVLSARKIKEKARMPSPRIPPVSLSTHSSSR